MGPAGFEPATSSARGWHPAKLDNGPKNCTVSGCNPYYMSINMLVDSRGTVTFTG
jgi:hypothetical protein